MTCALSGFETCLLPVASVNTGSCDLRVPVRPILPNGCGEAGSCRGKIEGTCQVDFSCFSTNPPQRCGRHLRRVLEDARKPQQVKCEIWYKCKEVSDLGGTNLFEEMKNKVLLFATPVDFWQRRGRAHAPKKKPQFHRVRRASAASSA